MSRPLDYASGAYARRSPLALVSLAVAILSCPCLSNVLILNGLLWQFPPNMRDRVAVAVLFAPATLGIIIALVALTRIYCSGGRLRGSGLAAWALAICIFWIVSFTLLRLWNPVPVGNPG